MIDIDEVIQIQEILIEKFGGIKGVRDLDLLESAISRPFQTFDNIDLYNSPIEKAAAIIESILINHPFIDGNKRIGYVLMRLILLNSHLDIEANENDKYEFVISIAKGERKYLDIKNWILQKSFKT
ncbi:MAG: Fic family protein [Bacteroidetes bacterium]|nr:Fic family protein [Bacteroidota bacterium]